MRFKNIRWRYWALIVAVLFSVFGTLPLLSTQTAYAADVKFTYISHEDIRVEGGPLKVAAKLALFDPDPNGTPGGYETPDGYWLYNGGITLDAVVNNGGSQGTRHIDCNYNYGIKTGGINGSEAFGTSTGVKASGSNNDACPSAQAVLNMMPQGTFPIINSPASKPPAGYTCPAGTRWMPGRSNLGYDECLYVPAAGNKCPKGGTISHGTPEYGGDLCNVKATYTGIPDDGSGSTDEGPTIQCETSILNPLTWLLCPIVLGGQSAVRSLNDGINTMLNINTGKGSAFDTSSDSGKSFHDAWNTFRVFGTAIIVIGGLAMVIAQAAGVEFLDAYTVKKTMPRLLVAAIFMTLSWYVVAFLIQLSNDLGNSLRTIIYHPFSGIGTGNIKLGNDGPFVANLLGNAVLFGMGILGIFIFIVTALGAVLTGFIVLIVRKMIILLLIIVAPLAIACYVLPNTQKLWTLWKDTLTTMLVVFPIIAAFIAVGRVFSIIAYNTNANGGIGVLDHVTVNHGFAVLAYKLGFADDTGSHGLIATITAFIAYFLPYFLIKQAFDLAGGIISTVSGAAGRATGGFQRWGDERRKKKRERRQEKWAGRRAAFANGNLYKGNNRFLNSAINTPGRFAGNVRNAGLRPSKMRSRMQAAAAVHEQQELAEYMDKNAAFNAGKGNDDYLQATMHNMGGGETEADWRRYLSNHGYEGRSLEQGVAQIRAMKRGVSNEVFQRAAVIANAATGTGWKEGGAAAMLQSINEAAGGDRHTANQMLAQMRGMAMQSGRVDLGGAGFGTTAQVMQDLHEGNVTADQANRRLATSALFSKDAGTVFARARGDSVKLLAPHVVENLKEAHAAVAKAHKSNDQGAIERAERELGQQYAAVNNMHHVLVSSSPENAQIFADTIGNQGLGDTGTTVMDNIDRYTRGDPSDPGVRAFQETTQTYGSAKNADEAATAAAQAAPPPGDGVGE